ncbi:universal stress protein [Alkalimarinus sediminis]|uniref:Universal stress protein n=1 Tax=Alkalimarinus sediminis TaxID=1632866 RepID=A0A9E8HM52_9ALTE|nr:universal stress protein [Alkalimarinus sediminis]UZW76652.1 universal stress protein [Alkalimarinus sediminis]
MNVAKILVVIDPKKESDLILTRAARLARSCEASLELYVAAYSTALEGSYWFDKEGLEKAHRGYLQGKRAWLNGVIGALQSEGVAVEGFVEWSKPLHRAVLERAEHMHADLIMIQAEHHSVMARALFTNSDWHLIRESQIPLWFVHEREWGDHLSVAAAVDPLHAHSKAEGLDDQLLQTAHGLACQLPGELHVIHAYEPIPAGVIAEFDAIVANYEFYREEVRNRHREGLDALLKKSVEPSTIVHFEEGTPERVLPQIVNEENIDMIVMGAMSRNGLDKLFIGNTAERVLDHLRCDILILKSQDPN